MNTLNKDITTAYSELICEEIETEVVVESIPESGKGSLTYDAHAIEDMWYEMLAVNTDKDRMMILVKEADGNNTNNLESLHSKHIENLHKLSADLRINCFSLLEKHIDNGSGEEELGDLKAYHAYINYLNSKEGAGEPV
jgi:hypothetical protein